MLDGIARPSPVRQQGQGRLSCARSLGACQTTGSATPRRHGVHWHGTCGSVTVTCARSGTRVAPTWLPPSTTSSHSWTVAPCGMSATSEPRARRATADEAPSIKQGGRPATGGRWLPTSHACDGGRCSPTRWTSDGPGPPREPAAQTTQRRKQVSDARRRRGPSERHDHHHPGGRDERRSPTRGRRRHESASRVLVDGYGPSVWRGWRLGPPKFFRGEPPSLPLRIAGLAQYHEAVSQRSPLGRGVAF
jgi:hypothetical protein